MALGLWVLASGVRFLDLVAGVLHLGHLGQRVNDDIKHVCLTIRDLYLVLGLAFVRNASGPRMKKGMNENLDEVI